jgi:NADH dehydrogenase
VGDCAYLVDSKTGAQVPGVSQGALQMGKYVAKVIRAQIRQTATGTGPEGGAARKLRDDGFHYTDYGSMATIGKSRAVAEIGPLRFGGLLAWLAWLALHVTVLIGFRNRIAVLLSWIYNYIFYRRGSRLITGLTMDAPQGSPPRD